MDGGDADVKCVDRRVLRKGASPNQLTRNLRRPLSERENSNPVKCPEPASTGSRIANSSLVEQDLRDKQTVQTPPSPPTPRELLVGREHHVTTWLSDQVTDDPCLNIEVALMGSRFPREKGRRHSDS